MTFDERMAKLRARFLERTQDEKAQLEAALDAGDRDTLRRIAHGLSGSAGVFGFPKLGTVAQALEEGVDAGAGRAEVESLARALIAALAAAGQED